MITNDLGPDAVPTIELCKVTMFDAVVQNNHGNGGKYDKTRGGAISFSGAMVDIGESQLISNSPQGAIQGADGYLKFRGMVTFVKNSGENGGAINLLIVRLTFLASCAVSFGNNRASRLGGAVYTEIQKNISFYVSAGTLHSRKYCAIIKQNGSITFQANSAQLAGHATPLYDCYSYIIQIPFQMSIWMNLKRAWIGMNLT